jgi:hypothetical protein
MVEEEAAARRAETTSEALGAAAVRAQKPFDRPARPNPAPLIHAFARRVRRELYKAYHLFLAAFRDAADRLRSGDRNALFPGGQLSAGSALCQHLGSSSLRLGSDAVSPLTPVNILAPLSVSEAVTVPLDNDGREELSSPGEQHSEPRWAVSANSADVKLHRWIKGEGRHEALL